MHIDLKKINFKSIIARWFTEVFTVTTVVLIVIGVILSSVTSSIYYDNVRKSAASYAREFSSLSSATSKSFKSAAVDLCEGFASKDKIEVRVADRDGNAFVSTSGFAPDNVNDGEFFAEALKSSDGVFVQRSRSNAGEYVMTGTNIVRDKSNRILGAFTWAVSLKATRQRISFLSTVIFVVLVLIFILYAGLGIRFLDTIVTPIREVGAAARKIAAGDLTCAVKKHRDDEIGDLCDTVNYMASELQNTEKLKNDFISSVSHELRTPLTAIRGWGETAKSAVGTDEELVSRGLDVVLSEADRLSNLVEELLDFSRMQQGRLKVTTSPIDVSELLRTVTDMYSELARKQGIEISYTPPAQNAIVMGDRDRLKQVFINIIDNAVKYTEKGGLVLIVQTLKEGCIQIEVKDTGVGIPVKDIDHVKEKFYKANNTVRGSGIGLAVADEIIKQHDGLLFIESKEGVGTTVTVVLPLYDEPETETAPDSAAETLPPAEEAETAAAGDGTEEATETAEAENVQKTAAAENADFKDAALSDNAETKETNAALSGDESTESTAINNTENGDIQIG